MSKVLLIRTAPPGLARLPVGPPPVAPPLGLLHIASALRAWCRTPVDVSLRHLSVDVGGMEEVEDLVRALDPDVVGLSGLTIDEVRTLECARAVRKAAPRAVVVVGGPHATLNPGRCLAEDAVDWVVIGEGERTMASLVDALASGKRPEDIPGLAWSGPGGGVERSRARPFIADLDTLPGPAWDLVDLDLYSRLYNFHDLPPLAPPYAPLVTSRGCPWRCMYCHNLFGRKTRFMSAGRVLEEVESLVRDRGVGEIHFVDDLFNADAGRMMDICDGIIDRGLRIKLAFPNGLRGDTMTHEQIDRLKDAGCYSMTFAVETASPRLQKMVRKRLDVSRTLDNVRHASEIGLITGGYMMLGFPTETREEMESTIAAVEKSAIDMPRIFSVCPFPGTDLHDLAVENGFDASREVSTYDYDSMAVNASPLTDEEMRNVIREARRRIYKAPGRLERLGQIRELFGGPDAPFFQTGAWRIIGRRPEPEVPRKPAGRTALVIFNTMARESRFWGNIQVSILSSDLARCGVENEIFVALMRPGEAEHNRKVVDDLMAALDGWKPDAVVFHALWLPWLPEILHRHGVRLVLCLDKAQHCDMPVGLRDTDPQAGVLAAILGATNAQEAGRLLDGKDVLDRFAPRFEYRFIGAEGPIRQTLAFVSMQSCPYDAPISANEIFDGLDLPGEVSRLGCSYCNGAGHVRSVSEDDKSRILEQQVRYLQEKLPDLEEIAVPFPEDYLEGLRRLVRGARDSGIRPITFSGQFRHQALVGGEAGMGALLSACKGTGFEMHVNIVGLESFDARDLALYNRGRPEEVREAVAVLRRLRSRFDPATFMPGTVGSFILFHPWQDLEGLTGNVEAMEREGIADLFSSINVNDLRFHPGVPLYHLARRDGLVVQVQEGSVQDVPLSGYFTEHPWRFRDPEVAAIHRLWKALEMRLPDRQGLLAACTVASGGAGLPTGIPDPVAVVDAVDGLSGMIEDRRIQRSERRFLLHVGAVADTNPSPSLWAGARFDADLEPILARIRSHGSLDGASVTIAGPEPTMNPHLAGIVAELRRAGAVEVEILTYGRRLAYPWFASALASAGVDLVTFIVHSGEAGAHDGFVRVSGAFSQAVAGMRNLASMRASGKGPRTALAAVASARSPARLTGVAELARSAGASELRLMVPTSALALADMGGQRAVLARTIEDAKRLGIPCGFDVDTCFRWVSFTASQRTAATPLTSNR